ncbi:MAG TPA: zinc-binding dehydrogenase [Candidatus Saccharimonadales bacterium]|nr:zinc-binding dehydrogenase [Candidatus Saccharimonadales bacterium]
MRRHRQNILYDAINILAKDGSIVVVGLFETAAKIPIAMTVLNEYKIFGTLWGNYNELREVIESLKDRYKKRVQTYIITQDRSQSVSLTEIACLVNTAIMIYKRQPAKQGYDFKCWEP